MEYEASDYVYQKIADRQNESLFNIQHQHPETRTFSLADGSSATILLREKITQAVASPLPISGISGVVFRNLPRIITGSRSEIVALTGERPFYVVEHGSDRYDFDSYGIHLGQDDRLVFLGESCQQIVLKLIGMLQGSPTLHMSEEIIFNPSPHVELAIPRGVGTPYLIWGWFLLLIDTTFFWIQIRTIFRETILLIGQLRTGSSRFSK